MENDQTTTVSQIKQAIEHFADERDWKQFHNPKNLAMAIASEVGELNEHFRWVKSDEAFGFLRDPDATAAVASELADVMMFALEFATVCEIDLTEAIKSKLKVNEQRYPVGKSKGNAAKYDRLQ